MSRVAEADHDRPLSKVAEMALRAFIVLWERDKWEAMKLADEFKDRKTT
jgi:hypothetical protein